MSEKDIQKQRKYITDLIKSQSNIFKLNGKSNREITLSLPKVTGVNKTLAKNILEEILGYKPEITFDQELKILDTSTMLITIVLQK